MKAKKLVWCPRRDFARNYDMKLITGREQCSDYISGKCCRVGGLDIDKKKWKHCIGVEGTFTSNRLTPPPAEEI